MQQKIETGGEIESWIYEQARIDDDDIVAMYGQACEPHMSTGIPSSAQHSQC